MGNRIGFYYFTRREIHRFLKVINQTVFPPIVSSLLYIAVFYFVLGRGDGSTEYLQFLVPGLVIMAMVNNAFQNSSSSLFIAKWTKNINHLLTMPLSFTEIALGYVIGAMARGIIGGLGIMIVIAVFIPVTMHNLGFVLLFVLIATFMFGSLGVLAALWAEQFDHIGIFNTFFLTPLTMLGGVFYSIERLPDLFKTLSQFNPVFFLVDGFRYGMIGTHDGSLLLGIIVSVLISIVSFGLVVFLMKRGYKIKE